jgi:hypothetical protein
LPLDRRPVAAGASWRPLKSHHNSISQVYRVSITADLQNLKDANSVGDRIGCGFHGAHTNSVRSCLGDCLDVFGLQPATAVGLHGPCTFEPSEHHHFSGRGSCGWRLCAAARRIHTSRSARSTNTVRRFAAILSSRRNDCSRPRVQDWFRSVVAFELEWQVRRRRQRRDSGFHLLP